VTRRASSHEHCDRSVAPPPPPRSARQGQPARPSRAADFDLLFGAAAALGPRLRRQLSSGPFGAILGMLAKNVPAMEFSYAPR